MADWFIYINVSTKTEIPQIVVAHKDVLIILLSSTPL